MCLLPFVAVLASSLLSVCVCCLFVIWLWVCWCLLIVVMDGVVCCLLFVVGFIMFGGLVCGLFCFGILCFRCYLCLLFVFARRLFGLLRLTVTCDCCLLDLMVGLVVLDFFIGCLLCLIVL